MEVWVSDWDTSLIYIKLRMRMAKEKVNYFDLNKHGMFRKLSCKQQISCFFLVLVLDRLWEKVYGLLNKHKGHDLVIY